MKKLLFLPVFALATQLQYFYSDNIYLKILEIRKIKVENETIYKKVKVSDDFYEGKIINKKVYYYRISGRSNSVYIKCYKKINFKKLNENTDILKEYNCKIYKTTF